MVGQVCLVNRYWETPVDAVAVVVVVAVLLAVLVLVVVAVLVVVLVGHLVSSIVHHLNDQLKVVVDLNH